MKNGRNPLVKVLCLLVFMGLGACRKDAVVKSVFTDPKPIQVYAGNDVIVGAYDFKTFKGFLEKDTDTTYVVNFWATWCAPCVAELPNFEKLGTANQSKKVKVLLVSLDFKKQVEKSLLPFIKKKGLQSKVILLSDPDANSWIAQVDKNWSGAIPATLIINNKKNMRRFYEQSFTYKQLQTEINPFIK